MIKCKKCGEERWILNKDGICIYCLKPIVRETVDNIIVGKKGGGIIEIKETGFIKEYR